MKKSLWLMTLLAALTVTASIFADDEEVWRLKPGEERELTINGKPGKIICEEAEKLKVAVVPVQIKKNSRNETVWVVTVEGKPVSNEKSKWEKIRFNGKSMEIPYYETVEDADEMVKSINALGIR